MYPCEDIDLRDSINRLNSPKACCCNCKHLTQDFHHCTTVPDRQPGTCHCNEPKGWICMGEIACDPENGKAHSGWSDHGLCELHEYKEIL